MLTTFLTIL